MLKRIPTFCYGHGAGGGGRIMTDKEIGRPATKYERMEGPEYGKFSKEEYEALQDLQKQGELTPEQVDSLQQLMKDLDEHALKTRKARYGLKYKDRFNVSSEMIPDVSLKDTHKALREFLDREGLSDTPKKSKGKKTSKKSKPSNWFQNVLGDKKWAEKMIESYQTTPPKNAYQQQQYRRAQAIWSAVSHIEEVLKK
jgi:hypothetical protein